MAYTPLNWQSGDIVTAEKLNQMKGGVLVIEATDVGGVKTLEYSYQDIVAMINSNILPVYIVHDIFEGIEYNNVASMTEYGYEEGYYCDFANGTYQFTASTETEPLHQ